MAQRSQVLTELILRRFSGMTISPFAVCPQDNCQRFFFFNKFILFIYYFWLCWVFVAARGLSLVAASGATLCCGARASHCGGFSCCGAQAVGARASVVVVCGLSSCGARAQ